MMRYITKNNLKNWKWWIASLLIFIFALIISPLIIIGCLADLLSDVFDYSYDFIDNLTSPWLKKLKVWVNK